MNKQVGLAQSSGVLARQTASSSEGEGAYDDAFSEELQQEPSFSSPTSTMTSLHPRSFNVPTRAAANNIIMPDHEDDHDGDGSGDDDEHFDRKVKSTESAIDHVAATSNKRAARRSSNSKKNVMPTRTVEYLRAWMMSPEHIKHPYPTDADKRQMIADNPGLNRKQLNNWFTNNRKRYWKPRVEVESGVPIDLRKESLKKTTADADHLQAEDFVAPNDESAADESPSSLKSTAAVAPPTCLGQEIIDDCARLLRKKLNDLIQTTQEQLAADIDAAKDLDPILQQEQASGVSSSFHSSIMDSVSKGRHVQAATICQLTLMRLYGHAFDQMESLPATIDTLKDIRLQVSDMWCYYANVLLEIAAREQSDDDGGDDDQATNRLSSDDWKDQAIVALFTALSCPLVGNHWSIAMSLARIVVSKSLRSEDDSTPTENTRKAIRLAISLCFEGIDHAHGRNVSRNSSPLNEPQSVLVDELLQVTGSQEDQKVAHDEDSVTELPGSFHSIAMLPSLLKVKGTSYIFVDTGSASVFCNEINRLSKLEQGLVNDAGSEEPLKLSPVSDSVLSTPERLEWFRRLRAVDYVAKESHSKYELSSDYNSEDAEAPSSSQRGTKRKAARHYRRPSSTSSRDEASGFIWNLFLMVNEAPDDTVAWTEDGSAFIIGDRELLEREVLPEFFKHDRYTSLVRQLNHYNFHKANKERDFCVYKHALFHRDHPEDLHLIKRRTHT